MLAVASPLVGQTASPGLTIGTAEITIGMSADQAVAALQEHFKVDGGSAKPIHQWFVTEKPQAMVGVIYVQKNAVVGVEHLVFSRPLRSAEGIFAALYDAASRLHDKTRGTCELSTWSKYNPVGLTVAGIHIDCGLYRIPVVRSQYKSDDDNLSGTSYDVWEDLGNTT
jgi:hypothetical protein